MPSLWYWVNTPTLLASRGGETCPALVSALLLSVATSIAASSFIGDMKMIKARASAMPVQRRRESPRRRGGDPHL